MTYTMGIQGDSQFMLTPHVFINSDFTQVHTIIKTLESWYESAI